jgi:hypothetical protein
LKPPKDNRLICYVEDLHLSYIDACGDQPAVESIRDYLTAQAWLSSRKRRIRRIENLSFLACLASNASQTQEVSERALHRFNLIALDDWTADSTRWMYKTLIDVAISSSWPSSVH